MKLDGACRTDHGIGIALLTHGAKREEEQSRTNALAVRRLGYTGRSEDAQRRSVSSNGSS